MIIRSPRMGRFLSERRWGGIAVIPRQRSIRLAVAALASVVWQTVCVNAQPRLDAITPVVIQRGQEVTLQCTGAGLGGVHSLLAYRDGLDVLELQNEDANRVRVRCRVSEDCQPGWLALRLACASGISTLRTVTVSVRSVLTEQEPNDSDSPQWIPLPCTVTGVLTSEDEDSYAVDAIAGQRMSFELEGIRLGYEFFDACLEWIGPDGPVLAVADDSTLTRQDPFLVVEARTTGRHVIRVRERTRGGNDRCRYALHAGHFPRPAFAMPGGGPPGELIRLSYPGGAAEVRLPDGGGQTWPWFPADDRGEAPSPLMLHLASAPNFLEVEPNFPRAQANPVELPTVVCGAIAEPKDFDQFRFHATKGEALVIRSWARSLMRSPLDAVVRLYQADGRYLAANDDSGGPDPLLEYTIPQDGEYIVDVRDHLERGGPDFVYRLEIAHHQPALTLRLPERLRNVPATVSVPQSNRTAVLLTVQRQSAEGDVATSWTGLPEGITVTSPIIPQGRDRVPVLFQATSEVLPQARLASLQGKLTDSDVAGRFQQRTMLVIGQNNRDMWGHDADRVAVAVSPPAPFRIELPALPDPLVRSGEIKLPVQVVRDEGFTGPVQLQMVYNPPGVSSPGSVTVPGDQSVARVTLTANQNAAMGEWPIVLLGQTEVNGVRHEVSTDLVTLRVEDSYFDVNIGKASVTQGTTGEVVVKVKLRRIPGRPVRLELVGLPPGVATDPQVWESDQAELRFEVVAADDARAGTYRSVMCRFQIDGELAPIVQTSGNGQLRIDKKETADG